MGILETMIDIPAEHEKMCLASSIYLQKKLRELYMLH